MPAATPAATAEGIATAETGRAASDNATTASTMMRKLLMLQLA
ncbi:hypothetical protein GL4_1245 [Methyloceanibacter caenitepidi]|uniref:Uncharacterized protein n=1 Tax=Methyloceanibacter caenitepidi TaxID=1384459 RepID=A0A0A8K159_9HYPH|nr:hypothetical protein GL4_1245 [Methyloceanibacter caenitepidi]